MWLLLILAVNINNPSDVPGRVSIKFDTEQQCLKARSTIEYKLKFDSFKVTSECKRHENINSN
jgi:hypothetical protein